MISTLIKRIIFVFNVIILTRGTLGKANTA